MREIFKIIKENIILLLGTGLFTFFLSVTLFSYYSLAVPGLTAIGVIFIVIGLLKIRKKKGEN